MDWVRALRQIVALATLLALALLAPPALADASAMAGTADHHVSAPHVSGPMDCCPDAPDRAPDPADCQPGMACYASPAAIVQPPPAGKAGPGLRIGYGPTAADLIDSRPPDGLLRPPRPSASC